MQLRKVKIDDCETYGMQHLKKDDKFLLYETTGELIGLFLAVEDYKIMNEESGVGGLDCVPLDKDLENLGR